MATNQTPVLPGYSGVVDLSHWQAEVDFAAAKEGGIVAVVVKCTQGTNWLDAKYYERFQAATEAELLVGSYHFGTNEPVADQVANFLSHAHHGPRDLLAQDFEWFAKSQESLDQARDFAAEVEQKVGRPMVLYSGAAFLKQMGEFAADSVLNRCPLWVADYRVLPQPPVPPGWSTWTMWQYTDGSSGHHPHATKGVGPCDRSTFNGSAEDLAAFFSSGGVVLPQVAGG
jgi:lysozyme